jgi:hypothetical protein
VLFSKMKYAALAFAALCAVSPTAVADEIGSWHFGSGKDGPPAESGGLISLANDEDDRLFIRCSNNAYRLAVMYIADPAPTAINPKVRIDVDNNNWIEGDAKIDGTKIDGTKIDGTKIDGTKIDGTKIDGSPRQLVIMTADIEPRSLAVLSQARTAIKVTAPGGHQIRFIAHGTREAFRALHDAC